MGCFCQPSWMWKVGKPFVFGPIGGGERAPVRLRVGMPFSEKLRELTRDIVNVVSGGCRVRATYRHAASSLREPRTPPDITRLGNTRPLYNRKSEVTRHA